MHYLKTLTQKRVFFIVYMYIYKRKEINKYNIFFITYSNITKISYFIIKRIIYTSIKNFSFYKTLAIK